MDIRDDLEYGTSLANRQRSKPCVKLTKHSPLKPDMKTLLEKKPLVIRNKMKIPSYPKKVFSSTLQNTDLRNLNTSMST